MRGHVLAPCAAAHAVGRGSHPQRPQMVLADHGVALRLPDREARVRVRRDVLPAGGAVRAGLRELAHHRCRLQISSTCAYDYALLLYALLLHIRTTNVC